MDFIEYFEQITMANTGSDESVEISGNNITPGKLLRFTESCGFGEEFDERLHVVMDIRDGFLYLQDLDAETFHHLKEDDLCDNSDVFRVIDP